MAEDDGEAGHGVVERRITLETIETGVVQLGPEQSRTLRLPEHSQELNAVAREISDVVEWNTRRRTLGGEFLAEYLVEEARAGEVLRVTRDGKHLHFRILAAAESAVGLGGSTPWAGHPEPQAPAPATRRPRRSGLAAERFRLRNRDEYDWRDGVGVLRSSVLRIAEVFAAGGWDDPAAYELRMRGERLAAVSGFDELLSADLAKVDQMPHQYSAALRVLAEMQGRAILADEVGLGKTIEAGLIAKELMLRGLVEHVLVICPVPLREQWQAELAEKFQIDSRVITSGSEAFAEDNLVMGMHMGRNNTDKILARKWDLVIVDEAHRNLGGAVTGQFVKDLGAATRYLLFLTATPVQNSLMELHRLVEHLRPGTFPKPGDFRRRFCSADDRSPVDPEALRELLSQVMVRTTRGQAGLDRVQRHVEDVPVRLTRKERADYHKLLDILRDTAEEQGDHLRRAVWARRLVMSPRSLALSLNRANSGRFTPTHQRFLERIADAAEELPTSRQSAFLELVRRWVNDPDKGKVVAFTQQTDVAQDLIRLLVEDGIHAVPYFGTQKARSQSLQEFRSGAQVMVATEAGAEGLNLQFANCVVNYDLPWNPMKIEQRIGRVDRLTQTRDVHVANLFTPGTVEDRIYRVLRDKLRMFELLFGQITLVLGEIDDRSGDSLEDQIAKAIFADDDIDRAFDRIEREAEDARARADEQIDLQDGLSGWMVGWDISHREGLTTAGDDTLLPDQRAVDRQRQRQVTEFVQDILTWAGAKVARGLEAVVGDDNNASQVFLTAKLPEAVRDHFGGVDRLHLAFHSTGLDRHPDAELCAAGSDVFEELVDFMREHGDLVIEVPVLRLGDRPLLPADPELRYDGRTVLGPVDWSTEGTWVRRLGGESGPSDVTGLGHETLAECERRPLLEGEPLPATLKDAGSVLDDMVERATTDTAELARRAADSAHEERVAAFAVDKEARVTRLADLEERIRRAEIIYYSQKWEGSDEEYSEAASDACELDGLYLRRENQQSLLNALNPPTPPTPEARLELLGARIIGGSVVRIAERWTAPDGQLIEVPFEHDVASSETTGPTGSDGRLISVVAACHSGHVVDLDHLRRCPECACKHCDACSESEYVACNGCNRDVCPACMADIGLCVACSEPKRDPSRDRDGLHAYLLGGRRLLLVGPRSALLDGAPLPGVHREEPAVTLLLAANGYPPDSGLRWDPFPQPDDEQRRVGLTASLEIDAVPGEPGPPTVTEEVAAALDLRGFSPEPGEPSRLAGTIAALRDGTVWDIPAVNVREVGSVTSLLLTDEGPMLEVRERRSDGGIGVQVRALPWSSIEDGAGPASLALLRAEVAGSAVTLRRLHRSHLLEVRTSAAVESFFVPGHAGATVADEQLLAAVRDSLDVDGPPGLGWAREKACPEPVNPPSSELIDRQVAPYVHSTSRRARRPLEPADLGETDMPMPNVHTTELESAPVLSKWAAVCDLDASESLLALTRWYRVEETWAGDVPGRLRYQVEGGTRPVGPLGDTGDFLVDRSGHFVAPAFLDICPVCDLRGCPTCEADARIEECVVCGKPACGTCRTGNAAHGGSCATCGDLLCGACGRSQQTSSCALCGDPLCQWHAEDGRCTSCSSLRPALPGEIPTLPSELAATGHLVLVGDYSASGAGPRTVVIAGGLRRELARVDTAGNILRWVTYSELDEALAAALARLSEQGPVHSVGVALLGDEVDESPTCLVVDRRTVVTIRRDGRTSGPGIDSVGPMIDRDDALSVLAPPGARTPVPTEEGMDEFTGVLAAADLDVPSGAVVEVRVKRAFEFVQVDSSGVWHVKTDPDEPLRVPVDWAPTDLPGTLVARGLNRRVTLRAFGNCGLVEAVEPDNAVLIGPGSDHRSSQRQLQALREQLGVSGGLLVAASLDQPELRDQLPGVALIEREVRPVGRVVPAPVDGRPVDAVELPAGVIGADAIPDTAASVGVPVAPTVVAGLLELTGPAVGLAIDHLVMETWEGQGRRTVEYMVLAGEHQAPLQLDLPEGPGWVFGVDRSGHLVRPDHLERCPICDGQSCRICDDDHGLRPCPSCGATSCGRCRAGELGSATAVDRDHRPAAHTPCVGCGSVLCVKCTRWQRSSACVVCEQAICHLCADEGRCPACAAMEPVIGSELPESVRATGHRVLAGTRRGMTVALIAGGARAERLVIRNGLVVSWVDYSGLDPATWRLVFEGCGAAPAAALIFGLLEAPLAVPIELRLRDEAWWMGRLQLDGQTIVGPLPLSLDPPTGRGSCRRVSAESALPVATMVVLDTNQLRNERAPSE